jgi:long-chain fatty acid transport protein
VALVLTLAAPGGARAGGTFAGDPGAQAQQRGGAFVAKADDPTAIAANPAGLLATAGTALSLGVNVVDFSLTFDRDGSYQAWAPGPTAQADVSGQEMPSVRHAGPVQPVPIVALTRRFGPGLAIGLGLHAPQGYPSRDLPATVSLGGAEAPAPQRYDVIDQEVLLASASIAAAARLRPDLDVGLRLSAGAGTLHTRSAVWGGPNPGEDPQLDGIFDAEVHDYFVPSAGVGLLWRATPDLHVGLAWSSALHVELEGRASAVLGGKLGLGGLQATIVPVDDRDARCATGGQPGALATCIDLTLPQTAQLGARWIVRDRAGRERGDVELDLRWEDWSAAADIPVIVDGENDITRQDLQPTVIRHGFQDVLSVRLGGAWRFAAGGLTIEPRAGVAYDTATAPGSWQRLDIDGSARLQLAGGVAVEGRGWRVEVGGAGIVSPDRRVDGGDPFAPLGAPGEPPAKDRTQPDAVVPNETAERQYLHPINNGTISSGYLIFSAGATLWW